MLFTHLPIIILALLLASPPMFAAASTPSFPDMTCRGSGAGTCTANDGYCFYTCAPGNAPFFAFGPSDNGSECHPDLSSREAPINVTSIDMDVQPSRVKPREPQGSFVQNTGSALPNGHCIVSCDRVHLSYQACSYSGALGALHNTQLSAGMALAGALLLWLG